MWRAPSTAWMPLPAPRNVRLIVTSGYRSDAEQAELFKRHPDPKWVAPPGKSLHRLGTELDLGPRSAYAWLARNAERFHFVQRYSWVLTEFRTALTHAIGGTGSAAQVVVVGSVGVLLAPSRHRPAGESLPRDESLRVGNGLDPLADLLR
jgi:hypothetical protein